MAGPSEGLVSTDARGSQCQLRMIHAGRAWSITALVRAGLAQRGRRTSVGATTNTPESRAPSLRRSREVESSAHRAVAATTSRDSAYHTPHTART